MKKQLTIGRIACYLLCLTLVCTALIGVSYARYTSSVNGSATAATAAVAGKMTNAAIDVSGMKPGDTKTVDFTVVNFSGEKTSEVAQEYTITIKTAGNLPLAFSLSPGAGIENSAGALRGTGGVWQSDSPGLLPAAAATTHAYTLTVVWPENETSPRYADEIDTVTLVIDAQQVVPGAA